MRIRAIFFIGFCCELLCGCEPSPFTTELAGYKLEFPVTLERLQREHPKGRIISFDRFTDSTQSVRVEWWFNVWGNTGNSDPKNMPHGVVLFLKNGDNKFDSVKVALENRYKQTLSPIVFKRSSGDFSKVKPIYVCHINSDTFLTLAKSNSFHMNDANSLILSIGYNLSRKGEEAFALFGGPIYNDKL